MPVSKNKRRNNKPSAGQKTGYRMHAGHTLILGLVLRAIQGVKQ